jgi:4-alpha-glucanotransferase
MTHADWADGSRRGLAMQLDAGVPYPGAPHDRVWIAVVAAEGPWTFALPETPHADGWARLLDTSADAPALEVGDGRTVSVDGPAVVVCASGRIAREARARWRTGLPPLAIVDAGDPGAAIELAIPSSAEPFAVLFREEAPPEGVAIEPTPPRTPVPAAPPSPAPTPDAMPAQGAALAPPPPARAPDAVRDVASRPRLSLELTVASREPRGRSATVDGRRVDRVRVPLGVTLPTTTAAVRPARPVPGDGGASRLVAAPPRCWLPAPLRRAPGAWALSAQVYALRTAGDWGIGDLDAVAALARRAAALGASALLLSPLHARSLGWTDRGSPYSPSSRLAIDPMYVSLPRAGASFAAPRFDAWCARAETHERIAALRATPHVDLPAVAALKRDGLERLWADFRATRTTALTRRAAQSFDAWRAGDGARLRAHLLFEALAERHGTSDRRAWPAGFENPAAPAAAAFERANAERIGFHAFVQWLAARQWREAGEAAAAAGMTIGPIADLAVGADPGGADAWARPGLVDEAFEIGAPPDAFSADGQAWGLPPWRPETMAALGHAPFVDLLRATMGGAGGVRIDHVMALERLYWVPRGGRAVDGAYVGYPLDELLALLATESVRHRCLVLGEDLGTVRPGLREHLARAGVLSYRVAWFERDAQGRLVAPDALPALSAVCASTHDLPTIAGFARALDVDERAALGAIDAPTAGRPARRAGARRGRDRGRPRPRGHRRPGPRDAAASLARGLAQPSGDRAARGRGGPGAAVEPARHRGSRAQLATEAAASGGGARRAAGLLRARLDLRRAPCDDRRMNAGSILDPLARSGLAQWLQSGWVFPIVESLHILSIALLVGGIAVVDARLMGFMRHGGVAPLLRSALPVAVLGFCGAVATGSLLFAANAGELLANRAFTIKLLLLSLAGLNAAWFHASAAKDALQGTDAPALGLRIAGASSLLLWGATIVAGRLIAYV